MGTLSESERLSNINSSVLYGKYYNPVDNESAYEFLARMEAEVPATPQKEEEALTLTQKKQREIAERKKSATSAVVKSVAKTTGGTIGREIGKSIGKSVGGSFGKTLGGNVGASLGRGILSTLFKS